MAMKTDSPNTEPASESSSRGIIGSIFGIVTDLLQPQKTWGEFSRKMISLGVVTLVTFVGFNTFWRYQDRTDKFIPVAEMMRSKPKVADMVKEAMEKLHKAYPEILGIWLYSWPDATTLDIVHRVGQGADPIPAGAFRPSEAADVGRLEMDICTVLERPQRNTACTIFGAGDAWGILVVVWADDVELPRGAMAIVDALANRITHLLYYLS